MIIRLNLTEDHLKLVKFLSTTDNGDGIFIPKNGMLTMRNSILDDTALILGYKDKAIGGTTEDAEGAAYPDEIENYLLETYNYVKDNLYYIETLLHQRVMEGIQPGEYKAKSYDLIWEKCI
jgi:hypothetical protein